MRASRRIWTLRTSLSVGWPDKGNNLAEDGNNAEFSDELLSDDNLNGPSYFRSTNRVAELVEKADPYKGFSKADLKYAEEVDQA